MPVLDLEADSLKSEDVAVVLGQVGSGDDGAHLITSTPRIFRLRTAAARAQIPARTRNDRTGREGDGRFAPREGRAGLRMLARRENSTCKGSGRCLR